MRQSIHIGIVQKRFFSYYTEFLFDNQVLTGTLLTYSNSCPVKLTIDSRNKTTFSLVLTGPPFAFITLFLTVIVSDTFLSLTFLRPLVSFLIMHKSN